MGQPKALLPFDKLPLISHIVETLSQMFDDIVVVTAPELELPVLPATLVRDEVSGQGPVDVLTNLITGKTSNEVRLNLTISQLRCQPA